MSEVRSTMADKLLNRRLPSQQRGKVRYDLILDTAAKVIAEKGCDGLKMSDIVERAGIPFGSLYQYFADKTAVIGSLAERHNLESRKCVAKELENVTSVAELNSALHCIVDGYYSMLRQEPVIRDIWYATQTDKDLQQLDREDKVLLAQLLVEVLLRLYPQMDLQNASVGCQFIMQMIAAAVRHAITLEQQEAEQVIHLFKQTLPCYYDKWIAEI